MCNSCLSPSLSCQENFAKNGQDKGFQDAIRADSRSILSPLLQLQPEWMTCMLIACLRSLGQALSKNTSIEDLQKKRWVRILSRPWVLRLVILFLALFYVGIPISFYLCPWVRKGAVFLHFADWPFQNLSSPEYYGMSNTFHFFVNASPSIMLGVWHVLPQNARRVQPAWSPALLDDDRPVVLYLHGSAESRSAAYRRSMYRVLTSAPVHAHVITFDYRGFGDSTYVSPTVRTLEEDASAMYRWLRQAVPASRIVLWGHSLGTGVAIRLGERLASADNATHNPLAVVLEAPFTSVADATHTFPLSYFHRRLPFFRTFCSDRTDHPDTRLDSEARVGGLTAPLLVFHAADDGMVWSEQGKRIWTQAVRRRDPRLHRPVFVELAARHGCGHRNIHRAPEVPRELVRFLESVGEHAARAG